MDGVRICGEEQVGRSAIPDLYPLVYIVRENFNRSFEQHFDSNFALPM